MLNGYKENNLNIHGLKALLKNPTMPDESLGIGDDDTRTSIPLLIFCDQHLPIPGVVLDTVNNSSYEKEAAKGSGDVVTLDNFVTDDFQLGAAIKGY